MSRTARIERQTKESKVLVEVDPTERAAPTCPPAWASTTTYSTRSVGTRWST